MEQEVVLNPSTGKAARQVINFVDLERETEEAKLADLMNQLEVASDALDAAQSQVDSLESAVSEQKSLVAAIGDIEQATGDVESESDTASSEMADGQPSEAVDAPTEFEELDAAVAEATGDTPVDAPAEEL